MRRVYSCGATRNYEHVTSLSKNNKEEIAGLCRVLWEREFSPTSLCGGGFDGLSDGERFSLLRKSGQDEHLMVI